MGKSTLVPIWAIHTGVKSLDEGPQRPVLIECECLNADLKGQVLELTTSGARIMPDQFFLLWKAVPVALRFRYNNTVYLLSGDSPRSEADHSFRIEFDSITRHQIALIQTQFQSWGGKPGTPAATQTDSGTEAVEASEPVREGPPEGMPERRAHRRFPLLADARLLDIEAGKYMNARILNLSLGGIRVRTEEPNQLAIHAHLEIEFLGHGYPFRFAGELRHRTDESTCGLVFLGMSRRTRQRLDDLLSELYGETSPRH